MPYILFTYVFLLRYIQCFYNVNRKSSHVYCPVSRKKKSLEVRLDRGCCGLGGGCCEGRCQTPPPLSIYPQFEAEKEKREKDFLPYWSTRPAVITIFTQVVRTYVGHSLRPSQNFKVKRKSLCRPELWAGRVDHWWLFTISSLSLFYFFLQTSFDHMVLLKQRKYFCSKEQKNKMLTESN